jgi:hypothetical protein
MKIIEALNPLHNSLEDYTSTVLGKITDFSTFTYDKLNDIPTKDFVLSTSEQYLIIFSNKLMDLEEKIDHKFASLKNEMMDKIKS